MVQTTAKTLTIINVHAVGGSGVRYRRGANALRKEFAILSRNLYIVHVNGPK